MSEQVSAPVAAPAASTAPVETPSTAPETQEAPSELEAGAIDGVESEEGTEETTEENKPEAKKRIKQLKLKVFGKEVLEDLPFEIDEDPKVVEYLQKQLQLAKMGHKNGQEATNYKKQLDEVADFLKGASQDPKQARELLKELKIDEAKLIESILEEAEELAKKSPEQIQREKLEAELKALKDEREQEKKQSEEREFQRLVELETQKYDQSIDEAVSSSSLPKSEYVIKKVADYMLIGLRNGIDVQPKDVISLVEEEVHAEFKQMIELMGEDKAEQFIGQDVLKKIRKKNLAKAKPAVPVNKSVLSTSNKPKEKQDVNSKKQTFKDFLGI